MDLRSEENNCYICLTTCIEETPFTCKHTVHKKCLVEYLNTLDTFAELRYSPKCSICKSCFEDKKKLEIEFLLNLKKLEIPTRNIIEGDDFTWINDVVIDNTLINYTEEEEKVFLQLGYDKCPNCSIWIEKIEGCNRIQCPKCLVKFAFKDYLEEKIKYFTIKIVLISAICMIGIIMRVNILQSMQESDFIMRLSMQNIQINDYNNCIKDLNNYLDTYGVQCFGDKKLNLYPIEYKINLLFNFIYSKPCNLDNTITNIEKQLFSCEISNFIKSSNRCCKNKTIFFNNK